MSGTGYENASVWSEADIEKRRLTTKEMADQIALAPGQEPLRSAIERCGNDKELLNEVLELLGERATLSLLDPAAPARDPMANQKIWRLQDPLEIGWRR
jgi:hypothetical protein